jgi:hypothetical protein
MWYWNVGGHSLECEPISYEAAVVPRVDHEVLLNPGISASRSAHATFRKRIALSGDWSAGIPRKVALRLLAWLSGC